MKTCNKLAAVVVTYNRKELLTECLEALQSQQGASTDILVVDNASTDGTRELVRSYVKKSDNIGYIRLSRNIGGAGGFSGGIREAVRRGYKYIWIMDDDTIARKNALAELMSAANRLNGDFAYLSSRAVWLDGSDCLMNEQKLCGSRFIESYRYMDEGIIPIKSATFVSLFINRDAVVQEGLPYKQYFIWGDDKEYTLRLSKTRKAYRVNKSQVLHKMQTNNGSNVISDDEERISRYRYAYRNDLATARKCGVQSVLNYYVVFVRTIIRILQSQYPQKLKRIKTMIRGMSEGILFHPEVEYITDTQYMKKENDR